MLNTLPLTTGTKEAPCGGRASQRLGSKSPQAQNESRDSFASTLDKVRGEKDPAGSTRQARTKGAPEDKREAEGEDLSKRPAGAEAEEAQGDPKVARERSAPETAGDTAEPSPDGAGAAAAVKVAESLASKEVTHSPPAGTGNTARTSAPQETVEGGKGGPRQALSTSLSGSAPTGASDAGPNAPTTAAAAKHGDAGPQPTAAGKAVQGKVPVDAARLAPASATEKGAAQTAAGPQADPASGEPEGPAAKRTGDMAQRQPEGPSKGAALADSQSDSGSARNKGGRSETPEAAVRQTRGGERSVETGQRFGEMMRENAPAAVKDDAGSLSARHAGPDGAPPFTTPAMAPKTAAAANAGLTASQQAMPSAAASFGQDNFHQLVERALFTVRGGQSEARIALKPDQLGHVRLQIITENQAVSIRIVTESPVARDLIDANAHQLRSELQQQGLNVQTIEVAVSDDNQDAYRGARQREAFLRHLAAQGSAATEEDTPTAASAASAMNSGRSRAAGIDYFA